ncbi:DUF6264 family protein [Leifsonia sp. NPDC058230]|uniref:DUF6264 family protein n=1 Tax=Leifsonia sp. NPDC058230 TaxID=3346391 RepID=UPI0036DB72AE
MADDEKQPDKRPRPQFGELAPEGWVWHPPADQNRLDTSRPLDDSQPADPAAGGSAGRYGEQRPDAPVHPPAPHPSTTHPPVGQPYTGHPYPPPEAQPGLPAQLKRATPRWNVGWTIALLIVGFLGMSYSIGVINAFPAAIQLVHANENLGDYVPAPSVSGIMTAGSIAMGAIWIISTGITVLLLVRRRMSFYVPLIAGVIAFIALFVFLSIVISTDPALLSFYSGISPATTTPPTSTP